MTSLQWKRILPPSTLGFVFAGLTIPGWIHGLEGPVVLVLIAVCGVIVALVVDAAPFRNGLATGFLFGLWAVWTQALFLPIYFDNNPTYRDIPIPFDLDPQLATFVFGPLNALVAALITGLISLGGHLLRSRGGK